MGSLSDLLPNILSYSFPISPVIGIGMSLVISSLKSFSPFAQRCESFIRTNITDKIIDLIIRNQDPLYEFSYRLNAAVNALR